MNRVSRMLDSDYAYKNKVYGTGIGVAIVDTGICLHNDFNYDKNRILAFKDFVNNRKQPYDDNGHGTHIAGIVGGNGWSSKGRYMGIAPDCNLISVKVLDHKGDGKISDVLAGLQWIIDNKKRYNIRVVNISVGTPSKDRGDENTLLVQGVNAVWNNDIVVVVAAGNNGPKPMSISTPGISRKVITVGSSDDDIMVEVSGNKTKDYSGRGPTVSCIKKPDIVAPGSNIISCSSGRSSSHVKKKNRMFSNPNSSQTMYTIKSGTSMATPIVTGAIALLLSVNPEFTPKDVKTRLRDRALDLGQAKEKQGWGMLNIKKLLE
ncbi:MAG TPA: S8 family peptidase [Clostridiales bacterium]|nr:S8 family peptidase [Clostridiales bacterium]